MAKHDEEVAPYGIHQLAYASNTDPASDSSITMRPYKGWIDTGNSNKLQVRNAANTDWEDISIGGTAGSVSFGSNSNSVAIANQPGASSLSSRADHVHLGVRSLSHTSNTFSGPVIITNSGIIGITSPTAGTLNISAAATAGGGGGTPDAHAASHESGGSDEIDVTGLTGAGGGSGYDLDTYSIDATYGDDFTAAALTGIWTRRNFVSGAETHQLGKNATYMRVATTGRAVGDGYLQTAPAGDWTFAMAIVPHAYAGVLPWGVAVVDSSGTGVGTCFYNSPNAFLVGAITTYSTYGGSFQACPAFGIGSPAAYERKVWQYLRKSGTNYYCAFSFDGEIWSPESAAQAWAGTVDRVGMLIHPLGSVGTEYVDVDWFNKTA